jgi:hypothetical protein
MQEPPQTPPTVADISGTAVTGVQTGSGQTFESTAPQRVANNPPGVPPARNVMRHQYRMLSDDERMVIKTLKDKGADLWETIRNSAPAGSRELSIALTKLEEAIMWAVKHHTG